MSNSKKESENLWNLYVQALETWRKTHESWQKAGQYALQQYAKAMNLSWKDSDMDLLNKYNEEWAKTWSEVGQNPYHWYFKAWEDIWKDSSFVSLKSYSEHWLKIWKDAAEDVFRKYSEMLVKRSEIK